MTAQKPNQIASAVHPCARDSRSARLRTSERLCELHATMSRMPPSSRFRLIRRFSRSYSQRSFQKVLGQMSLATAFVAPVAVSFLCSVPRLTTAPAESGARSRKSNAAPGRMPGIFPRRVLPERLLGHRSLVPLHYGGLQPDEPVQAFWAQQSQPSHLGDAKVLLLCNRRVDQPARA